MHKTFSQVVKFILVSVGNGYSLDSTSGVPDKLTFEQNNSYVKQMI